MATTRRKLPKRFRYECQEKGIGDVNVVSQDHIIIDVQGNDADLLRQLCGPVMRMELINRTAMLRYQTFLDNGNPTGSTWK